MWVNQQHVLRAAIALCALARPGFADTEIVRLIIDQSQPTVVIPDGLLPAGKPFTAEFSGQGYSATDQVVLEIWPGTGPCMRERTERQFYELAMVPSTADGQTTFRANVPPLQIRNSYCLKLKVFSGLPPDMVKRITDFAVARAARWLNEDSVDTRTLQRKLDDELAGGLAPELRGRGYSDNAGEVAAKIAEKAVATLASTGEYTSYLATLVVLDKLRDSRDGVSGPGRATPGLVRVRGDAAKALTKAAVSIAWPDRRYLFVIKDALVSAENVWKQLADRDLRAALDPEIRPQIERRLRDDFPSTAQLVQWRAELARVGGRQPAMPVLAAPAEFDLWTGSEFVRTTDAGRLLADRALDKKAGDQLDALIHELDLLCRDKREELADPKIKDKRTGELVAELAGLDRKVLAPAQALRAALAGYAAADQDLEDLNTRIKQQQAGYQTQRQALIARLGEIVLAAFKDLKFRLSSAGPPRSGVGKTNSLDNWVSANVGVAVAAPTFDVAGGHHTTTWILPYFAVNLHAPLERTIPPGELIDEFWQRVSFTVGVTLTRPDAFHGHAISALVFDRPALVSIGFRVTPYSRLAAGVLFYRVQANPLGGDPVLGVAPFLGYSLDLDAVKLVKDGFTGF